MLQNMMAQLPQQQMQQQMNNMQKPANQGGNASLQVITQGPGGQMFTDSSMQTPYNPPSNNMPQMPLQQGGITSIQQPPQRRIGNYGLEQQRPQPAFGIKQPMPAFMPIQPPQQIGGPVQPPSFPGMRPMPIQPPQRPVFGRPHPPNLSLIHI